jgi:lipoprotein-anchoring transpeptidase ErfK/SrfK
MEESGRSENRSAMRVSVFIIKLANLLGLAFLCASCAPDPRLSQRSAPRPVLYGWHDDGGEGRLTVRISLPDQIAEFQRGGREIGWSYVATGKEGHGTRPGSFRIMEKIEDKYSNRYGWIEDEFGNVVDGDAKAGDKVPPGMVYVPAPMPFWMRLTSYGIGMHGGLIPEPGKPASHGCIRLPKEFVPILFDSVDVGTPVTITSEPSKHGPRIPSQVPLPSDLFVGEGRLIGTRPLESMGF